MKKIISIILVLGLLICTCGCEDLAENINSDFVSEIQNLLTEDSDSAVSSEEQKAKQEEKFNFKQKENTTSQKEKTESKEESIKTAKEESSEETVTKNETIVVKSRLPEVKFSDKDSNVRFTDMINLSDGGFAISGHRVTDDLVYSVIQVYNESSNLKNEYSYRDGNGFDKIAACSDGGFIAASYCPPCITKINSNFETEWFMPYENIETSGTVQDIEEISPDLFAVLFVSVDFTDFSRRLKISY